MGIHAYIYTDDLYRETRGVNDGQTRHVCGRPGVKGVTVIDADGPFEPCEEYPAVRLVVRQMGRGKIIHAEPVEDPPKGWVGYYSAGAYISASDSRFGAVIERLLGFRFYGAIALHDRCDTQAVYEALSQ